MIEQQDILNWKSNTKNYLFLCLALEQALKDKKIKKKEKKEMEKKLDFHFLKNYWNLNPFIKDNPLLREIAISFLKRRNCC